MFQKLAVSEFLAVLSYCFNEVTLDGDPADAGLRESSQTALKRRPQIHRVEQIRYFERYLQVIFKSRLCL